MARPATGTIQERRNAAGTISRTLRFYAGGTRREVALGPVMRKEAEDRLAVELARVRTGGWEPSAPRKQAVTAMGAGGPTDVPTFHVYAEEWWKLNAGQLAPSTKADYRWRLEKHLLEFFAEIPLDEITVATVEAYTAAKLAEDDPLSPRSINMTVTLLGAILERAVRHEIIGRNAARGCRVRERAPKRSYLDTAGQIEALLDAAGELDKVAPVDKRHVERRAMLATLTFAGLRIGEMCSLRWRDVDLKTGWLTVQDSKTDAGRRRVKVRGALEHELVRLRTRFKGDGYVFPTSTGRRMSPENFRKRVLAGAVKRANDDLAERKQPALPDGLTPHSLRRTFCSLLYAVGEDPGTVMDEMGHTDPALALRVYRQAMRRGEDEKRELCALIEEGAPSGKGTSRGRLRLIA